jgi:septum formation protein
MVFSMDLILGSQSPRRKEILSFFALPFQQIKPDFDEGLVVFSGDPGAFATEIAHRKGLALREHYPNSILLTADTVVYKEGRIFQKPESIEEAALMLRELSGKQHKVFTGVSVLAQHKQFRGAEETLVEFCELTQGQIDAYVKAFRPLDKAGAYAIQEGGGLIVKRIEGCYYNVMGLPLQTTGRLLRHVGIDLWDSFR